VIVHLGQYLELSGLCRKFVPSIFFNGRGIKIDLEIRTEGYNKNVNEIVIMFT